MKASYIFFGTISIAQMEIAQLRALVAVVDTGSFDAAAVALHVTPSAVSQRIKALEASVGAVLVRRARPATATDAGERYVRLGRQLDALVAEALAPGERVDVPVAVSSDALETWLLPALLGLPDGVTVDVRREDQGHSAALLRAGAVMAAITSDPEPVAGCTSERLGTMRYRASASAAFVRRWFPDGATPAALAVAPMVVFDRKDDLQDRYLAMRAPARGASRLDPPRHHIPESATFARAVRAGLGWGMLPEAQAGDAVVLDERRTVDVVLHWQQWALHSPGLDAVADAVREAAASALAPAVSSGSPRPR